MNIQFQRYPVLIAVVWAVFFNSQATANTYEVPKFKAFLPMSYNVPPTEAMPLDGVYMIAGMDKRIRIEKGRSYAVDSWMVMMVLEVRPNMVLTKDISPIAPGKYTGYNFTFRKEEIFEVTPAGNVESRVGGTRFTLIPCVWTTRPGLTRKCWPRGTPPFPMHRSGAKKALTNPRRRRNPDIGGQVRWWMRWLSAVTGGFIITEFTSRLGREYGISLMPETAAGRQGHHLNLFNGQAG
jgi:hypothetical protein